MSDNKIVYSNQGIKFLVDHQEQTNEVSKLKGVIDEQDYKYLEISGNVEFLNDVKISGDIRAGNLELLPASTKRVLFNKVGQISSSADFKWDFDTNVLSVVGEISASSYLKGDGTHISNLKKSNLDFNSITIGNDTLSLGDGTVILSGLFSVTSAFFNGTLNGNATRSTKLEHLRTISATGDLSWQVSFDGSQNVTSIATLSSTGVLAGTYNNSATSVRPFTVDSKGRITGIGSAVIITPNFTNITNKPTTLSGYGITDAQPLDADLTSIAGLVETSGYLKKTATNTWSLVPTITATSLEVARQINGTSFDGTQDITTTKWGTSRTIRIGNRSYSVDGSSNVTWTLQQIGAAELSYNNWFTGINTFSNTQNLFTGSFNGDGSNLTNISTSNIADFSTNVRNQFSAGTNISISNGVISATAATVPAGAYNGAIQFKNGASFGADPDFHWDSTNNRMGIGTRIPDQAIEIKTAAPFIKFANTSTTVGEFGLHFVDNANEYVEYAKITYNSVGTNKLSFYVNSSTAAMTISNTGVISGDGSGLTNLDYNNISNVPASTSPNDSTITISAGTGLATGGSFTTNQSFNETITLSVDSTVLRTNVVQTISAFKTFSALTTFNGGFESTTGYCGGDFSAGVDTLVVDQSLSRVGINTVNPITFFHVTDGTSVTCIKDTVSKLTVEGGDAHLQIASDDGGSFGSALVLSNGNNHWFIHNVPSTHGTTDNKRNLEFRYKQQTTNGDFISSSTIKAIIKEDGGSSTLNFTGQHRNKSDTINLSSKEEHIGLIVVSEGTYASIESNSITINEALPKVSLSSQRNQKSVFGVISDIEDQNSETREYAIGNFVSVSEKTPEDTRLTINSIGEGGIWICNINGNLENGDYITTCEVPGYGMKQDSEFLANYTVAKITCDCDFDLNSPIYMCEEFEWQNKKYLKAFVGCTYHCG